MKTELKFTGGPELEKALKDLGGQIAGRLGTNAVRAGARVIAASAKRNAPVLTGALKKSIRVFDEPDKPKGERVAYIGSRLFYARFVEFGTSHTQANPFLRPALDESAQAALDKLAENLSQGIERETVKKK
jgi:HK97 gp10 family phage protein